ncbi:glycosyltransferase involved in cell wall biosynthesis [Knoellia remsis]|uniref:D-inositol 3-phosphate glycosyltransferase n=1 Tax=Knoellia remsis TaxID=407159 RepID=A0A2T0V0V7_9MICO|nr:glycosyltransferase family 4 protein [Knoellia remsis]PRY63820.1 glycosyltransferase involved in cell wall biosynthesis [Knoellia remsis]
MKVALVMGTSAGGTGRHVHDLVAGLVTAGHEVVVLAPAGELAQFEIAQTGAATVELSVADRPHPKRDAGAVALLREVCAGADVVHAHGARVGALTALALAGLGVPLVVTLHNASPGGGLAGRVHAVLERVVARRADLVLGVSADIVETQRRLGARRAELAVIAAPPPPEATRDRYAVRHDLGVAPRTLLLVTVARLAPQKDLDLLVDAMAQLLERHDLDVVAVVAGDGPHRERLQARIDALGVPIRLLGQRGDVPDLIAAADAVVSTARWEGQPVGLQEALHSGAAIVATDAGGTGAVLGDAAILVPVGDPTSMARALADVLLHGAVRDDLRSRAIGRAGELPDGEDALEAALTAYDSVL